MNDLRTWIEVDKNIIKANIQNIKSKISKEVILLGVVKGNALGLDTVQYSKLLESLGVEWLGITNIEDLIAIRENDVKIPILLLCEESGSEWVSLGLRHDLRFTLYTKETCRLISTEAKALGLAARVHVKINTGLNRIGIDPDQVISLVEYISSLSNIDIEGAFTQFSPAHDINKKKLLEEFEVFKEVINRLSELNIKIPICHVATTPSLLLLAESHLDMVRVGIGINGLYPSNEYTDLINIKYPMTWKTRVGYIRRVNANTNVGYDNAYITEKNTCIATIQVGISDGLSARMAKNRGFVLINSKKYPVVAISMNHSMVDIGDYEESNVKIGDEVVLIGKQGNAYIHPEEQAQQIDCYVEEILSHINRSISRIYL